MYSGQLERAKLAVLEKIKKYNEKHVVLNSEDVSELIYHLIGDDSEDEDDNEWISSLLSRELIYQFGDKDSYLLTVRHRGKISKSEHRMISSLKKSTHKIIFRDTEFPVNDDGTYNIPLTHDELSLILNPDNIAFKETNPRLALCNPLITGKISKITANNGQIYYLLE